MKLPSEFLFELSRDGAFEPDLKRAVLSNFKSSFLHWKFKHFSKGSFWFLKRKMARYLSSVLDLYCLSDRLVNEDISKVYLLLSEVSFRPQSFSFQF